MRILLENSEGGLGYRKKRSLGYIFVFENTPVKLSLKSIFPEKVAAALINGLKMQLYFEVQGRTQLGYSNHIVKVGVEAKC